jgi:hypothetical protein
LIVLDENILDAQRRLLESSHIAARQIGVNFGRKGLQDHEIIDLLRQHRGVTFFTRDVSPLCAPRRKAWAPSFAFRTPAS